MLACSNNKRKQKMTIYLMRTLLACGYECKQEKGLGSLLLGQIVANANLS
jgi:hypothetical protein